MKLRTGNKLVRYSFWLSAIILLFYLIKLAFDTGDFNVFLEASKIVATGETPYHKWIFISEGVYCQYFYSPFWALLLIPFSYLPVFIPNLLWLFANVWFLFRMAVLIQSYFESLSLTHKQIVWIVVLSVAVTIRFILYNFEMNQMTIFLLWGILESLSLINKEKLIAGGMLLALVINIKIMPVVILPYLLYRKEFKALIYTITFSLIFLFIPAVVLGWTNNVLLLRDWWSVINPTNAEHLLEVEQGPHSLTALIPTLFSKTEGALNYQRNIFDLSINTSILILNLIRLMLVLLTVLFLRWPPFGASKSRFQTIREVSYILLLIPLIFPHQQKYAFVLALPAQVYLLYFLMIVSSEREAMMSKMRWWAIVILFVFSFVLMTLTTDGLIGKELNGISQYYKTITYGALLLLVSLLLSSDRYFEKSKRIN